jgi:hypothetical protein
MSDPHGSDTGFREFCERQRFLHRQIRDIVVLSEVSYFETLKRRRAVWSHSRSKDHFKNHVMKQWREDPLYGDKKLKEDIRVDFATFDLICEHVTERLAPIPNNWRTPVSVEEKVMMTLDVLGNGKSHYQAGKNVGLSASSSAG